MKTWSTKVIQATFIVFFESNDPSYLKQCSLDILPKNFYCVPLKRSYTVSSKHECVDTDIG